MENSLPKGWIKSNLGQIADWGSGGTPKSTEPKYYGGTIPWLIIGDLNDGEIVASQKTITKLGLENSSAKMVPIGAVLCAMYGSIGKLGITKIPCATNQAIAFTEKIHGGIPNKYLFYYLFSIKQYLLDIGKGGAQQNISQSVLKQVSIPIAPLAEQYRIVRRLDELMEKIDRSRARLERIPKILKRFRQSVLSAAVSGKLTEQWRQVNKIGKEWSEWKIEELVDVVGGFAYKSSSFLEAGNNQVIRIGNVKPYQVYLDYSPVFISDEIANSTKKFEILENDILISMTGTKYKRDYGYACKVKKKHRRLFVNQRVSIIRPKDNIDSSFLLHWLQTDEFRNQFFYEETGNVNQGNVGMNGIKGSIIQLPPYDEQTSIARTITDLFAFADKIELRYKKAKDHLEKLPQSLLAKAFRGDLVSQDENDEPASVLLERIRVEKGLLSGKKSKRTEYTEVADLNMAGGRKSNQSISVQKEQMK